MQAANCGWQHGHMDFTSGMKISRSLKKRKLHPSQRLLSNLIKMSKENHSCGVVAELTDSWLMIRQKKNSFILRMSREINTHIILVKLYLYFVIQVQEL